VSLSILADTKSQTHLTTDAENMTSHITNVQNNLWLFAIIDDGQAYIINHPPKKKSIAYPTSR
jgi:hypothetical protein